MRLRLVLVCCALSLVVSGSASAANSSVRRKHGSTFAASRKPDSIEDRDRSTAEDNGHHGRSGGDHAVAPAFSSADLTARPGANWITNGGDVSNSRYSSLNQINTTNVSQLKEAWHVHLDGSGKAAKYSAEGTPVVYNGVMYLPTGNSDVFAMNAATGERIWTYHSGIEQTINTACCGWDNRGVASVTGRSSSRSSTGRSSPSTR